ncbi:MAG: hypothetical protein LBN07_04705 [Christensenellaceae bacterium]|jgi:hypothetical protein|nr:hypothetical protein [Christensenellaceae bacterium]
MGIWEYLGIGIGVCAVLLVIIIILGSRSNKQKSKKNLVETKNARYTYETETTTSGGDAKISFTREDVMLHMGITYKVSANEKGAIKPGKYILLCSEDNTPKFNVRIGDYVKEYKHNQEVVLAEGSEITSVSASIILR